MWQGLISIMFLSQMYTCLTFFIYRHKLFIQSPLLSFIIARKSSHIGSNYAVPGAGRV